MSFQIFDYEQYSPEWWALRTGLPTASQFAKVMAKTPKGNGPGATQKTYMRKLAGEIITGKPMESYSNGHMQRGHEEEAESLDLYALIANEDPEKVGFILNSIKKMGASPDALVGDKGVVEIKSKTADLLIEWILKDQFPPEHKAQCQGHLLVSEREWVDIVGYSPGMPLFLKRAHRDEGYIKIMSSEIDRFNEELQVLVEQIKIYGHFKA